MKGLAGNRSSEERSNDHPVRQDDDTSFTLNTIASQLVVLASTIRRPAEGQTTNGKLDQAELINVFSSIVKRRQMRERFFDSDLFADPAWDILLDLALARLNDKRVSVTSLCIAAKVPTTTALRYIKHLTDIGIIERTGDPNDLRRSHLALSDDAFGRMSAYADALSPVDRIRAEHTNMSGVP